MIGYLPAILMPWTRNPLRRAHALVVGCGLALASTTCLGAADGKKIFLTSCASCHGKDGKAQTPIARKLGVKDLTQSTASDEDIRKQILEGRKDDRGNIRMPSFQGKLSEEQIEALLVLVKEFRK